MDVMTEVTADSALFHVWHAFTVLWLLKEISIKIQNKNTRAGIVTDGRKNSIVI